jgi:hypothetical protein
MRARKEGSMSERMTVRQIASVAGCNHDTVRLAAKRLFPDLVQNGRRTDFTKAQSFQILEALPQRHVSEPIGNPIAPIAPKDFDLSAIIRETVAACMREMVPAVVAAVKASLTPQSSAPLALPAPLELEPRDALRKIVGDYAANHDRDFRGAWSNLYREFELRAHRNIRQCAKNRGMDTLDYCEGENILGELLALAYCLYAQKAEARA